MIHEASPLLHTDRGPRQDRAAEEGIRQIAVSPHDALGTVIAQDWNTAVENRHRVTVPEGLLLMAPWSPRCTRVKTAAWASPHLSAFNTSPRQLQIAVARKAEKEILAGGLAQSHLRYVFRSQYLQGVHRYAIYRFN